MENPSSRNRTGGAVGKMLASHAVDPGFNPESGGYIVTQMITIMAVLCHWTPSDTSKNLRDIDKRSSPNKVKPIGQKHDYPSMTLSC